MYQIRRLLVGTIVSLAISLGISHAAGSMSLSPSTGSFGMNCVYPINFSVNVGGIESKAVDMRVLYSGTVMQFTGASANQIAYGTSLVRTGTTTVAIANYPIGSRYRLFNRSDLVTPLSGSSDQAYFTWYFQTIQNVLTGYIDFYFSGGWNGDDSNIQSGITNNFVDVLDTINSGYYNFVARPCIPDTDPALFTGYASGVTQSYLNGIAFTIYDFTGEHYFDTGTYVYNNTVHYRRTGGNYVQANLTSTGIDNQYGVNSGTISVSLSGLSLEADAFTGELGGYYSGGTLVFTSFTLATLGANGLFACIPMSTSVDIGYSLTWSGLDRGYYCLLSSGGLVGLSGVNLDSNQTIQVTITGADNINYLGNINTGVISFPITINGIDNTPPYIVSSIYQWTGALNGFNTTGAGPSFATAQRSDREYRTKDDVEIHFTGNEVIIMTNVVGFSGADLNVYVSGNNGYSGINQVLIFTGNMTGYVTFQDIPNVGMEPNYGQTYATGGTRYTYDFNIDVFRIDRIATEITGSLAYTGENGQWHHALLTLTGFATGYAGSEKDDEFYVYDFSGVDGASNSPNVTYVSGYTQTGYSLYHSGIVFNDNRTGYVLYRDRADNTGMMYVNVTGINMAADYTIIAVPAGRNYTQGAQSGIVARFAFVSGYESSSYLIRSGDVVFSGLIRTDGITSSTGFTFGFVSGTYTLILESQNHLSVVVTGLAITGSRIFNLTQTGDMIGDSTLGSERLIAGDYITFAGSIDTTSFKDGQINPSDIGAWLAWYTQDLKVYSGGFHVWTGDPGNLVPSSPIEGVRPYAQYHPGELDGDGFITSSDLVMLISNMSEPSHRRIRNGGAFFDYFN